MLTQDKGELIVQVTATGNKRESCYMYILIPYTCTCTTQKDRIKRNNVMIDWNHLNSGELIFVDCQFFKDLLGCYRCA